jgi:hypothetical protein
MTLWHNTPQSHLKPSQLFLQLMTLWHNTPQSHLRPSLAEVIITSSMPFSSLLIHALQVVKD